MAQVTLKTIYDAVQDLRDEVKNTYVTQDSFRPVRAIVYGMVGILLTSIVVALVTSVVRAR